MKVNKNRLQSHTMPPLLHWMMWVLFEDAAPVGSFWTHGEHSVRHHLVRKKMAFIKQQESKNYSSWSQITFSNLTLPDKKEKIHLLLLKESVLQNHEAKVLMPWASSFAFAFIAASSKLCQDQEMLLRGFGFIVCSKVSKRLDTIVNFFLGSSI